MNKTLTINIGGVVFSIEEDAYKKLGEYIDSIKKQFHSFEGKEDIIQDIEARIAELLQEGMEKDGVVLLKNVDSVIQQMGTAEDFVDDAVGDSTEKRHEPKRLFRDPDDQVIAGVCSGLGAYFGIDPAIVRVVFAVLTISGVFSAITIITYIVLYISVSEAKTISDKMEMKGKRVTLKNIEEKVRETVKKNNFEKVISNGTSSLEKGGRQFGQILKQVLRGMVKVFKPIWRTLFFIIGLSLILSAIAAIIGSITVLTIAALNPHSPLIDFPLTLLGQGAAYITLLCFVFLVTCIPFVFLLFAGISLIKRKSFLNLPAAISLIFLWILSIAVVGGLFFRVAPDVQQYVHEEINSAGSGQNSRTVSTDFFNRIDIGSSYDFVVKEGAEQSIRLVGRDRDLDRIDVRDEFGTLSFQQEHRLEYCVFCIARPITIEITTPTLVELRVNDAADGVIEGFHQDEIDLELRGSADLNVRADIREIHLKQSDSSSVEVIGSGESLDGELTGVSELRASEFGVNTVRLRVTDVSRANVRVRDLLDVVLEDASEVRYYGDPVVTRKVDEASELIRMP